MTIPGTLMILTYQLYTEGTSGSSDFLLLSGQDFSLLDGMAFLLLGA